MHEFCSQRNAPMLRSLLRSLRYQYTNTSVPFSVCYKTWDDDGRAGCAHRVPTRGGRSWLPARCTALATAPVSRPGAATADVQRRLRHGWACRGDAGSHGGRCAGSARATCSCGRAGDWRAAAPRSCDRPRRCRAPRIHAFPQAGHHPKKELMSSMPLATYLTFTRVYVARTSADESWYWAGSRMQWCVARAILIPPWPCARGEASWVSDLERPRTV